ncbi:hypothetical protein CRENPOLYSF2_1020011 [Crenothrix polyspora]|uniref:Uncharacterized protein n=1 Tax=Crenothrix polyspora TaxID=360316 RepID=A0A1R4GYM8_9GAMM|nr:hypothetical protein CRENPOLYSF2_1020011 [Crenothrix polyspora]
MFFSYGFDIVPYIVIKITPLFKDDSTTDSWHFVFELLP